MQQPRPHSPCFLGAFSMNKSIPRISYELRWPCKVQLNFKGCTLLSLVLQLRNQNHINSRSHGQKHAKHIQKSSTTWYCLASLIRVALPVSAPWQNCVQRLLTSAACAQELAGPHASKCNSLISNHTQAWRSRTKWYYPKYQKGAVHIQVLLGVFGAPGPRRAGESRRPRRCWWLVAGVVPREERLRIFG